MGDKAEKSPDLIFPKDPRILYQLNGRIIAPSEEQIEAMRKYSIEIGMRDTEDFIDEQ